MQSKLPDVGTTIFTTMSGLAAQENAINLSQGFPDFHCDPELVELVYHYMKKGFNQYAQSPGLPLLRERIANKTEKLYGTRYDPASEITLTAGASEALFCAITALVHPGDEVIIFDPAYDLYIPVVQLNRGIPVQIKLSFPEYSINWGLVEKAISSKTRLIILNSPHNPTGAVLSADDLHHLAELVKKTNILILSDEVYEHIIFDELQHQSVVTVPELAERSIAISSFGKTYHVTGWKTGYALAPTALTEELRKVHQFNAFTINTPIQHALADYILKEEKYQTLGKFYQQKRDTFLDVMSGSRFKPLPCNGTYFQMMDYSAISDLPDTEFAVKMTKEQKIASIPVSVFYRDRDDNKVVRFCFAKEDDTFEEAGRILRNM
ncbi:MAG: aminotransferase class I/II-fold pyridoxal phosphate-dependent enzyme [Calditrichaeota bacterium]|nr:MAG: aminotransferase class I/II-fold pyridoxal phosphate-dependent enzyme [Calditrichota bacterium]